MAKPSMGLGSWVSHKQSSKVLGVQRSALLLRLLGTKRYGLPDESPFDSPLPPSLWLSVGMMGSGGWMGCGFALPPPDFVIEPVPRYVLFV